MDLWVGQLGCPVGRGDQGDWCLQPGPLMKRQRVHAKMTLSDCFLELETVSHFMSSLVTKFTSWWAWRLGSIVLETHGFGWSLVVLLRSPVGWSSTVSGAIAVPAIS